MRGIVFDQVAARDIERRLRADGYAVRVARARLAGEDDDEDQPWAVETDAPVAALDLLLDAHDGWLDDEHDPSAGADTGHVLPLPLPDAPRRRRH